MREPQLQFTSQITYEQQDSDTEPFVFQHRLSWRAEFSSGTGADGLTGLEEKLVASAEIGLEVVHD